MPSKQVQIFVPLPRRSDTTGLSAVIQVPHPQPCPPGTDRCFCGNWCWGHGGPGHPPPLRPIAFAYAWTGPAGAWPLPRARGNQLSQAWWVQAHVSRCSAWEAEARGKCHMPSSSTISTAGDDGAKCAQNGKKGRKRRVCEVASYRAKYSCFRPWFKLVASKLPLLPCSNDVPSKTTLFCPAPKMEHQKHPLSRTAAASCPAARTNLLFLS